MSQIIRPSKRAVDQMRELTFQTGINPYAEGSCLVGFGNTKVLCLASIDEKVPPFLRGQGSGWVTAEYGMLPRSTQTRMNREASKGKQTGRTVEIQRLIGRSLRAVVDLKALGERQILIDCDVMTADGGTRTASITGAYVALYMALQRLVDRHVLAKHPIQQQLAAISCGVYKGEPVLDLDYAEDSNAQADTNFVMTSEGGIVEVQGTAEDGPFSHEQFLSMMALAQKAIADITAKQREVLGL